MQAPAVFDIDAPVKPGDQIVERAGRKAAGAEEDGEDELAMADDEQSEEGAQKSVDYFA